MPGLQEKIFPRDERQAKGRRQDQMPQVRKPQESNDIWHLLRQNIEKKLTRAGGAIPLKTQSLESFTGSIQRRFTDWVIPIVSFCFLLFSCQHIPHPIGEPERFQSIFEADEKVILRAIAQVLKDRGFGSSKIEADKARLETDYVVQEDWRTKVEASVKKLNRREREVTLWVATEKKTPAGWRPWKVMEKEQYEKLFNEIELQIYREMSKVNP